jgi:thioesterase domain-containing protein
LLDTGAPQPGGVTAPIKDGDVIMLLLGPEHLPMAQDDFEQLVPDEQVSILLKIAKQANVVPPDAGPQQIQRLLKIFKANVLATSTYVPDIYPHQITLFTSEASMRSHPTSTAGDGELTADHTLGWAKLSMQPLMVYPTPGEHTKMLGEPHVRILAEQLRRCLDPSESAGGHFAREGIIQTT